ncbi:hypothetical protein CI088_06335, partial [Enterococcus plantarum]
SAAVARALSRNNPVAKVLDALLDVQNKLNRISNTFEEDIRELQKKVEKLHQFSSQTNSLFATSLNDMKIAMQGVMILNNTVVNRDGTYQLPKGTDKSWFNQLKEKDLNEDRQPDVGDREYRLIDLGYGKMWMWVKKGKTSATAADIDVTLAYNKWLSRMIDKYGLSFIQGDRQKGVDELFYEQNATLIKELATGIDSVTGKKLTQAEMLGKASLLANSMITIGVMVKGVVNVGKTQNVKPRNTNKKASGLGKNIENVNPSEIRFSQTSVNGSDEIIASMKANGWKGDPIDVVRMPDGSLTTLDNTRVAAAREVGIDVQANVRSFDTPLPDQSTIDRFTTKKGVPKTWGEAIELRVGKQKADFRNNNPMGSFDLEKMK